MAVVLAQAVRTGTVLTEEYTVRNPDLRRYYVLSAILPEATLADESVTFGMLIDYFDGAGWVQKYGSQEFRCGIPAKGGGWNVPTVGLQLATDMLGRLVRGRLELGAQSLDIGIDANWQ